MSKFINHIWYQQNILKYFLYPFSLIYRFIIATRFFLYRIQFFKSYRINVPVIVVGNISVGGTGKTPLVILLVNALQKAGFQPGIITRGYSGKSKTWPQCVAEFSNPTMVGDEAVLIAKNTRLPVIAGSNRVNSARQLIRDFQCNIIISDDGLQHYALARDIEIAVIDSTRRLGNGFCLPAGPLREPKKRLKSVDFIVANGKAYADEYAMQFVIDDIVNIIDETKKITIAECENKKIIALAGIGNPERFFESLRMLGLAFTPIIFKDHHHFQKSDIVFENDEIIVMTEKDAVKCRSFADERHFYVRGHAVVDDQLISEIILRIH
ncbi:MAG: tetraacyldisaccharide 4'-kinase [Gammaproteobacteria bacterium RIFCSPHIGHO2_12_FULL_40_19]|nr:MAG: tetraacyldisaccharide 4'-kinase [Gammaproteobacteria bacterium RIFCSPHIGHO2_12_FULL_40_19]